MTDYLDENRFEDYYKCCITIKIDISEVTLLKVTIVKNE